MIQRIGYVIKNITNIDTLYKLKDYCDEQGLNFPSHYKPYLDKENHLYNIIPSFGKIRSYGPLVRAIPKLSKYESIEDIFVAINSSDEEIRQAAIQQSENFPLRDDILDLLLQALNDKDESVYLTTVNIFKKIATLETLSVLYQRIPKITSIYQLYDLIAIIASVHSKTKQYSLEPIYLPTDSEKKYSIEKASLSETPQSPTSPQKIQIQIQIQNQNFNFNAPVDTVAGNVQGNLINQKEGKE